MAIILSTSKTQQNNQAKKQTRQQAQFDKLWQCIERQKKQNQKLRTELDTLSLVYKEQIMPFEIAAKTPVFSLTEKLINFYSRKSMTKWQREELNEWIDDSLDKVCALDLEKAEGLKEQWLMQIANFHELDIDEMKETLKEAETDPGAFFEDEMNHEFDQQAESSKSSDSACENAEASNDDMFGDTFDDDQTDDDPFNAFEEAFREFEAEMAAKKAPEPLKMDEKWLKSVFRKTANALHPDKEQDAKKREEKQGLMTELLRARDENDVPALIALYHDHVSEDALEINEQSLTALCAQLNNQLDRLRYEKEDIISGVENPIYERVYTNLYGKSKKQQERIIKDYIDELSQEKQAQLNLIASLKTLKVLKLHLEERYDSKRYASFF